MNFSKALIPHGRLSELVAGKVVEDYRPPQIGPTRLVILQPTSFCNIDCSYCYVPDRNIKGLMPMNVLAQVMDRLVDETLLGSRCTVVWHAGEPLAAGKRYMEEAFTLVRSKLDGRTKLQLTIQTNATLIDEEWVALFRRFKVRIGVSLDGPQWLHDMHRKDRKGRGSFEATLRGLHLLQTGCIENYVLAVVTGHTLPVAQEFYDFFASVGVTDLGLIPEEVDGVNLHSSLEGAEALSGFCGFVDDLHRAYLAGSRKPEIREFRGVREALFYTEPIVSAQNNKSTVYNILTVSRDGAFTSFSPELSGMLDAFGNDYSFGNILVDSLRGSVDTPKFRRFYMDFMRGVDRCMAECDWFSLCGGGLPSNKLAEFGRLDISETMSCKLHLQVFTETVLLHYNKILEVNHD